LILENKLSGKTVLVIGIVLTVISASLGVLTWYNILTRERTLSDANLSVEERWRVEGSLRWWRDYSARLYLLAAGLFIGSLFTIVLSGQFQGKSKEAEIRARLEYLSRRMSDLEKYIDVRRQSAIQARVDTWRARVKERIRKLEEKQSSKSTKA
jgi:hypothetical protein